MTLLFRLIALVMLGALSLRRSDSPALKDMERLSWPKKSKLIWLLVKDRRIPLWSRGIALLPAIYVISPIDILPDFIPFLGRLDDAMIFGIAFDLLVRSAPEHVIRQHFEAVR
jgi:uncharacterized membrane protein YkvA (DUF1232 family)